VTDTAARGDRRRTALLESLDHHLRHEYSTEGSLDSINIADISRRAGVTRSAFYFYFENKASAVAALMEEMYDESLAAAGQLRADGTPAENIEAMVRALFSAWEKHEHLFRASLDARATSATVRELWDSDRESFVPVVADLIESERASGAAPPGTDATALASVLLELNDRMLERLSLGGPLDREQLVEAVVAIWLRTIYGEVGP
jgi:AcrR family transcriptional regulator